MHSKLSFNKKDVQIHSAIGKHVWAYLNSVELVLFMDISARNGVFAKTALSQANACSWFCFLSVICPCIG